MKISNLEQQRASKKFINDWTNKGYEKGETNKFWLQLLENVYGVEDPYSFITFETKIKLNNTCFIDGYIPSTHVLIEQKGIDVDLSKPIKQSDGTLLTPFQQAKRYASELPYSMKARWIIICNFREFHIYDMEKQNREPEIIKLENLDKEYYRLNFLTNVDDEYIKKEIQISTKAGEIISKLYNSLLEEYNNPQCEDTLKSLNMLCVRIVFCLYAEDAGLFFKHNAFHDYLYKRKSSFRRSIIDLFDVLNTKIEDRDPYLEEDLANFPYVNGGLFENNNLEIPRFNETIIDIILEDASLGFDWSQISPTIFGSLFESTLNPETRKSGGMHYTSIKNIHKLIDPLFLDSFYEKYEEYKKINNKKKRDEKLITLQNEISSIKILDPACGSGNFLTETYISLRTLENKIIESLVVGQMVMLDSDLSNSEFNKVYLLDTVNPIKVSIEQFFGIEINDFAVTVAKTALWIAESQMLKKTKEILYLPNLKFLPLNSKSYIYEGNALRIDWNDVLSNKNIDFIIGNPPFIGARLLNDSQREDVNTIFPTFKKKGNLDYVCCWYKKALDYLDSEKGDISFVSTSSICEGEMIGNFWKEMHEIYNIYLNFAWRSFKWNSEATDKAIVHCVIIGFSNYDKDKENKFNKSNKNTKKAIYNDIGSYRYVKHINSYLDDAPDLFIDRISKPLCNVPKLHKGCQPTDGGNLIIEGKDYEDFIKKDPKSKKYIKKLLGANEFLKNKKRYCLWLVDASPAEIKSMPLVYDRIKKCKEMRLSAKDKATIKLADRPTEFRETYNYDSYLLVPKLHSSTKKYLVASFFDNNTISTDLNYISKTNDLYILGIISSNVHMAWCKAICGRMGKNIRYSAGVVYNNFPWPNPTDKQVEKIRQTAQAILDARELYKDSTLSDLYDDVLMPPKLRQAHIENDKAVMEAYGFDWRAMTESECLEALKKLYLKLKNKKK